MTTTARPSGLRLTKTQRLAISDRLKTFTAASGATELDYEDGSVFDVTATDDITLTYANLPTVGGIVIYATDWGAHTITLPSGTELDGGFSTFFTSSGTDIIIVTTKDGGTTTEFLIAPEISRRHHNGLFTIPEYL